MIFFLLLNVCGSVWVSWSLGWIISYTNCPLLQALEACVLQMLQISCLASGFKHLIYFHRYTFFSLPAFVNALSSMWGSVQLLVLTHVWEWVFLFKCGTKEERGSFSQCKCQTITCLVGKGPCHDRFHQPSLPQKGGLLAVGSDRRCGWAFMLPALDGKTQRLVSGFHMHGLVLTHFFSFFSHPPSLCCHLSVTG